MHGILLLQRLLRKSAAAHSSASVSPAQVKPPADPQAGSRITQTYVGAPSVGSAPPLFGRPAMNFQRKPDGSAHLDAQGRMLRGETLAKTVGAHHQQVPNLIDSAADVPRVGFFGDPPPAQGTLHTPEWLPSSVAYHELAHLHDPRLRNQSIQQVLRNQPITTQEWDRHYEPEIPAMAVETAAAMRDGMPTPHGWQYQHMKQHIPLEGNTYTDNHSIKNWMHRLRADDNELGRRYRDYLRSQGLEHAVQD